MIENDCEPLNAAEEWQACWMVERAYRLGQMRDPERWWHIVQVVALIAAVAVNAWIWGRILGWL